MNRILAFVVLKDIDIFKFDKLLQSLVQRKPSTCHREYVSVTIHNSMITYQNVSFTVDKDE